MLQRLCLSSKAKGHQPVSVTTRSTSIATQNQTPHATFFDLPAEIRNDIYDLVARATQLHLFNPNTAKLKIKPIPGLLLVNRQCRNEYLPILLFTASIKATVTNFDFKPLQRVVGSLFPTELKSLRSNKDLTICLALRKCPDNAYANLRRWCISRASSLDKLTWEYELAQGIEPRVLRWFCEQTRVLHQRSESESVKWEVRRVSEALESDLDPFMKSVVRTGAGFQLERDASAGYGDHFALVMGMDRRRERGFL